MAYNLDIKEKMEVFYQVIIKISLKLMIIWVKLVSLAKVSKKPCKNRVSDDDVLLTNDDSLAFFYIRKYCYLLY